MNRMRFFAIALLGVPLFGCGGESLPKRVPVSGSVTYKGKAVEGATVGFLCEGAPRMASGITDKDGKFTLTTYEPNDGAIPGKHTVTVTKMDKTSDLMQHATDRLHDRRARVVLACDHLETFLLPYRLLFNGGPNGGVLGL